MALFRKKARFAREASAAPGQGIESFWTWWSEDGAARTADAVAARDPRRMVEELSRRVNAVHPGLAWELAAGTDGAEHLLVVSPEGNPELRATARRWLRAAPPPDETWEFADARQPVADLDDIRLGIDGNEVGFGEMVVTARRVGYRFDVTVHHPLFADLPPETQLQITYLALDAAVGETDTETWIGDVAPASVAPLDAFPLALLRGLVDQLVAETTDEYGEPTWVLLRGDGPSGPVLASAQVPLCPTAAPELDLHVAVVVPFAERTEEGFPGDASLQQLRDLEDHLAARVGDSGRLVAHETSAGVRTLHFYVDSTSPSAGVLEGAVRGWTEGRVSVSDEPDPAWDAVRHLRA
ncbi:MAG: DUF695 domain-containing protein [Nocardioidaceae bacterium]